MRARVRTDFALQLRAATFATSSSKKEKETMIRNASGPGVRVKIRPPAGGDGGGSSSSVTSASYVRTGAEGARPTMCAPLIN